jgi:hypothetical protein
MPANYVLLEKITVGAATASSVTFSNIPQTGYTDLVVKVSARSNRAALDEGLNIKFNGSSASFTVKVLYGNGSSAGSFGGSYGGVGSIPSTGMTANTFANTEIYIPNYTSANYKSFSADSVAENNATYAETYVTSGLWSNTAAITSMDVYAGNGGSFVQYTTFYLYGVAKLGTTPAIQAKATGGDTIMTDGTYWYHTFLSSGTFTPADALTCDYLVVAGGGGGGDGVTAANNGGGGGAGGYLTSTGYSCARGTGLTVTIGAGGAVNTSGTNSVFATITSTGGGRGGKTTTAGGAGGSGGGGSYSGGTAGGAASPSGQGNAGGTGGGAGSSAGGGGGAGQAGNTIRDGNGGNGLNTLSSWASVTSTGASGYYAGGGGGGFDNPSPNPIGGLGGGGKGAQNTGTVLAPVAGTANTGGGGGGGGSVTQTAGAAGGSGLVIVRYAV